MRRLLLVLLVVAAVAVVVRGQIPCDVVGTQPACDVALRPGPTRNTLELVEIDGEQVFPSAGQLRLTTVAVDSTLDLVEWVQARLSDRDDVVARDVLYPPGESDEDVAAENALLMEQSQTDAEVAGLVASGFDAADLFAGARIVDIGSGDAVAEGVDQLEVGDVVVAVDGSPVVRADDAVEAVGRRSAGDTVELTLADGTTVELVAAGRPDDPDTALLGVLLTDEVELPFGISIDAGNIGGPSAGLMFALGIVDLLDAEDLTAGATIAGTGTITYDGEVGAIGGIRQKIAAATSLDEDEGGPAEVFLVPEGNVDEARTADAANDVLLVPVATIDDALAALRSLAEGEEPEGAFALAG